MEILPSVLEAEVICLGGAAPSPGGRAAGQSLQLLAKWQSPVGLGRLHRGGFYTPCGKYRLSTK